MSALEPRITTMTKDELLAFVLAKRDAGTLTGKVIRKVRARAGALAFAATAGGSDYIDVDLLWIGAGCPVGKEPRAFLESAAGKVAAHEAAVKEHGVQFDREEISLVNVNGRFEAVINIDGLSRLLIEQGGSRTAEGLDLIERKVTASKDALSPEQWARFKEALAIARADRIARGRS